MAQNLHERILGCLLAGALGDSLGAIFENQLRPSFSIPDELRVTDDTQLTLATCESIIEQGKVDPEAIARQMAIWFQERRVSGIGGSTLKALTELSVGGHWAMVGASGELAAGNGAAMRISPLSFFLDPNEALDRRTIRDVSRITHRNDEAYFGALSVVLSINEPELDRNLISKLVGTIPDSQIRDRFIEIEKGNLTISELAKKHTPTGFVVDSVPFSILAAIESTNLMETYGLIIECGGDTDTTASMFGNILGAHRGACIIPSEIVQNIDVYAQIAETAASLCTVAYRKRSSEVRLE